MFYCETCRTENDWPSAFIQSHGKCELCDFVGQCHDRSSKDLPEVNGMKNMSKSPGITNSLSDAVTDAAKTLKAYLKCDGFNLTLKIDGVDYEIRLDMADSKEMVKRKEMAKLLSSGKSPKLKLVDMESNHD